MNGNIDFHEELELETDTTESLTVQQSEYYDSVYYDSDEDAPTDESEEEQWSDENDELSEDHNSKTKKAQLKLQQDPVMEDITRRMKMSSMLSGGCESLPKKIQRKHRIKSNDELLYDPEQDEIDQEWLFSKILVHRSQGTSRDDIWTDAILVCPMCWTTLCYDCQQHEIYPHQFRAMFVENCRIIENELLKFPKEPSTTTRKGKQRSKKSTGAEGLVADTRAQEAAASTPQFQPNDNDLPDIIYHPVVCESCNTKVAVIDSDEIYHFFHVIASDMHPLKS